MSKFTEKASNYETRLYIEDERKQEIAKNAKDDSEKKERGEEGREGLSAERRFKVCKLANKSKGEVGLWILDFGILFTD